MNSSSKSFCPGTVASVDGSRHHPGILPCSTLEDLKREDRKSVV